MHEVTIAQSILEVVQDVAIKNNVRRVLSINIKVGKYFCLNINSLQFAFECLSQGSVAEGARLIISNINGNGLLMESIEVD